MRSGRLARNQVRNLLIPLGMSRVLWQFRLTTGTRVNRNYGAADSFRIEVLQICVQESFRATGTKSLDEMNDMDSITSRRVHDRAVPCAISAPDHRQRPRLCNVPQHSSAWQVPD